MDKILVIFASYIEAFASIEKLKATQHTFFSNKYISLNCDIVISGLGIINAITTTIEHSKNYSQIIHVGFSGIINKKVSIGSLYEIKTVSKLTFANAFIEKEDRSSFSIINEVFPKIQVSNNSSLLSLASSDIPIRNFLTASYLDTDLVDMEAYGIASSSKKIGIPFRIFKLATDFPSLEGRKNLQKHSQKFSKIISNFIIDIIVDNTIHI